MADTTEQSTECYDTVVENSSEEESTDTIEDFDEDVSEESLDGGIFDDILYECDACGNCCSIGIFCEEGLDSTYCSIKCREADVEKHTKCCVGSGSIFGFCNYCNNRITSEDICKSCGTMHVCLSCRESKCHDGQCGKYTLKFEDFERFEAEICTSADRLDDISTEGKELTEENESLVCRVSYCIRNNELDLDSQLIESLEPNESKFSKYAMLETLLEMNAHIHDESIQLRIPFVLQFYDYETDDILYENICHLMG